MNDHDITRDDSNLILLLMKKIQPIGNFLPHFVTIICRFEYTMEVRIEQANWKLPISFSYNYTPQRR